MDLLPTDDQEAIAAAARELLVKHGYPSALRSVGPDGVDADLWTWWADLGWFGIGAPEAVGGLALGATSELMLAREIGRHVAPGPWLSTVLAAHAAIIVGDHALASRLVAGEVRAALAEPWRNGLQLTFAPGAEAALVIDGEGDGAALVAMGSLGRARSVPSLDASVPLAQSSTPAPPAHAALASVATRGALLAAALLSGIAEATRDLAATHASTREQFGRAIGTFQAVKHRCADMATRVEAAWAQTCYAAAALDAGLAGAEREAAAAKVLAIDAARQNAAANVQIHGGIGFTADHDAHLFVKRAHVWERACGDRRAQLRRMMEGSAPSSGNKPPTIRVRGSRGVEPNA